MATKSRKSAAPASVVTDQRAPKPLHPRKEAFCREYIIDFNAFQAAIRAGYSEKSARHTGCMMLQEPAIIERVQQLVAERMQRAEITADRVLQEVARVALSDVRRLFTASGTLKPLNELDDDTAASVASVEVLEEYAGTGRERVVVGHTKKIKFWDKNAGLEKLMKHLGMFVKDNEQQNPGGAMAEFLAELSERGSRLPIKADPSA
jgi:phage terminase small subunit